MDPNEALKVCRAQAALLLSDTALTNDAELEAYTELAEQFLALDEWLSKEGFPPGDWIKVVTKKGGK